MTKAPKVEISTLLEDFMWDDRRLAARTDIRVALDFRGRLDELPPIMPQADGTSSRGIHIAKHGAGSLELHADRILSTEEIRRLHLLAALIIYFKMNSKNRVLIANQIGRNLRAIRDSLDISQAEVAARAEVTRIAVSRWETGDQAPGLEATYRWCLALGLVAPERTALVRVVDFSPELFRFLQQNPEQLRALSPDEFERFAAERLDRMGYNVKLTGAMNRKDGGIDLIAVPKTATVGSFVLAGQVKHHRGDQKTGREAVDRLLAWRDSVFQIGLLVTNTSFTRDAVWAAQQERNARFLRLRDLTDLKRWLEGQFGSEKEWREIPDRVELAPGIVIEIPKPCILSPFQP